MNTPVRVVLLSAFVSLASVGLQGAGESGVPTAGAGSPATGPVSPLPTPAALPAAPGVPSLNPPGAPPAGAPAAPGVLPGLAPAAPGAAAPAMAVPPAAPGAPGEAPAGAAAAGGAVPTPPPLVNLGVATEPAAIGTTQALATAQGPIETYEFLFREDPDLGIVREKMPESEAQQRKATEIQRFTPKYATVGQAQGQQPGQDPRAGAEWDFYFEQLELYNRYVHEQVLQGETDLPSPTYSAQDYLNERNNLKAAFDKAAIAAVNRQHNENLDFYDRLKTREDRRRRYYEWLASQQRVLDEWASIWARKAGGQRWAGDQPVRMDDWYYGVNFASNAPKEVQIDGRKYLLSDEPQRKVPADELNVISSNLTPYDIVDDTGLLKTPELERLRGTAVHAPAESTTGVLELAP